MAAPSRSSASWERVLAAIEADAARAAALLVSDDAHAAAGIEYDGQDAVPPIASGSGEPASIPATWRLPASQAAATGTLSAGAAARAVAGYAANRMTPPPATAVMPRPGDEAAPTADRPVPGAPGTAIIPARPDEADATAIDSPQTTDTVMELPDPADMPPMTPEQLARFEALRERIETLKAELAEAVSEAEEVLTRPTSHHVAPQPRPELVDRRL